VRYKEQFRVNFHSCCPKSIALTQRIETPEHFFHWFQLKFGWDTKAFS
jgi:hypothetical protein